MRQYKILGNGNLELCRKDMPHPTQDEVLIKVKGVGINRADLLQREGLYPAPNGDNIPGLEVSGTIVGSNQKVCALLESGGYSEYVCVNKQNIIPINDDYDLLKAAALPEALTTIWMVLFDLGRIQSGQNILIHGGTSGIGSFAIQIARNLGCKVITSAGNEEKCNSCLQVGAEFCFDYHTSDFASILKEKYGGMDLVLDILGGKYLQNNIKALNKYGKLISIAVMAGSEAKINLASVLMKNITIIGTTLRSKPQAVKAEYIQKVIHKLMPMVYAKKVEPIIDSYHSFEEMENAHKKMKNRAHNGKIVVYID